MKDTEVVYCYQAKPTGGVFIREEHTYVDGLCKYCRHKELPKPEGEPEMGKDIDDFIKKNSKFLKLKNGEIFQGVYQSYKIVASSFDTSKETIQYLLEDNEGNETILQSSSVALANTLGSMEKGTPIKIKRLGEGVKTRYAVKSEAQDEDPEVNVKIEDDEVPF